MSRKRKGIDAERELIHLFSNVGWSAVRVAGSGSSRYPSPDIIAGNAKRIVAIECKSIKGDSKYVPLLEIEQLQTFGQRFGAECWIGARFSGEEWRFFRPSELERTEINVVLYRSGFEKGLCFDEFINRKI